MHGNIISAYRGKLFCLYNHLLRLLPTKTKRYLFISKITISLVNLWRGCHWTATHCFVTYSMEHTWIWHTTIIIRTQCATTCAQWVFTRYIRVRDNQFAKLWNIHIPQNTAQLLWQVVIVNAVTSIQSVVAADWNTHQFRQIMCAATPCNVSSCSFTHQNRARAVCE